MALLNEIQVGRFNRLAQKLLSMKGPASLPQLRGELGVELSLLMGVDTLYLQSWDRFGQHTIIGPNAGANSAIKVRNPVGSNVVLVFESLLAGMNANGGVSSGVIVQVAASTTDYGAPTTGSRLDPRGRANSTGIFSANNVGVSITGSILQANLGANTTWQFVQTPNQEIAVLPGDALQLIGRDVNIQFDGSLVWRERFLEESERT